MLEAIADSEQSLRATSYTLTAVLDASPIGIISTDENQNICTWNRAAERIFGKSAVDAIGQPVRCMIPEEEAGTFNAILARASQGEIIRSIEVKRRRADGGIIDVSTSVAPLFGKAGKLGFVAVIEDITERKRTAARLAHLASHDSVTGLPNRELFITRTAQLLDRALAKRGLVAVLCLNLDRFANITEALGHSAGDTLLQAVADRLQNIVGPNEIVTRLGGHEFAALHEVKEPMEAGALARRIMNELHAPYMINEQEIAISVNVGIAVAGP